MPPRFNEIRPDLYIPERLEAVVFKAMAKSPDDRHQTMAELTRDLDTAIPRAGKSQVLRTDFPTMPDLTGRGEAQTGLLSRMSLMHWMVITGVVVALIGLAVIASINSKPVAKINIPTTPSTATVTPPAAGTGTATEPPPAKTNNNTAAVPPPSGTKIQTTGGGTKPAAIAGGTSGATASDLTGATKDSGSGEGAKAELPKPKPKVATVPKTPHKPKHKLAAADSDEAPAGNSGAAAAYARRNAASASGDPFQALKNSRGY
jgi:hypothetical protein